jgi:hypothetical protein
MVESTTDIAGDQPGRVTATRHNVLTSLRQLGVPPDPATAILLRQTPTGPTGMTVDPAVGVT